MKKQMAKRGRPKLTNKLFVRRTATFLLPEEKAALAKAAREESRTVSGLMRLIIREWLTARSLEPK